MDEVSSAESRSGGSRAGCACGPETLYVAVQKEKGSVPTPTMSRPGRKLWIQSLTTVQIPREDKNGLL